MPDPLRVWVHSMFESEALVDAPELDVRFLSEAEYEDLTPSDLQGIDGYVGYEPELPAEAFEAVGADLKYVMRPSAGFDNLALQAATERGIVVSHAPQGPRDSVVEGVIGMMVSCARGLHAHNKRIREQGFEGRDGPPAFEVANSTVGIVGLGHIGRKLADSLSVFGPELLVFDPYADEETAAELGVELVPLEQLLAASDFVTIHTPLTDETHHMLGEAEFRAMKESAFVINAARGGIYPDEELARAVRNGSIAGAAVDVFEDEPDVADNPLLKLPQEDALLSPHILGNTAVDAQKRVRELVTETVLKWARDEYPPNVLNPEVYKTSVPEDRISKAYRERSTPDDRQSS